MHNVHIRKLEHETNNSTQTHIGTLLSIAHRMNKQNGNTNEKKNRSKILVILIKTTYFHVQKKIHNMETEFIGGGDSSVLCTNAH